MFCPIWHVDDNAHEIVLAGFHAIAQRLWKAQLAFLENIEQLDTETVSAFCEMNE